MAAAALNGARKGSVKGLSRGPAAPARGRVFAAAADFAPVIILGHFGAVVMSIRAKSTNCAIAFRAAAGSDFSIAR